MENKDYEEKKYNVDDIYIGFARREVYSQFLDDYEYEEDFLILEKTNRSISVNTTEAARMFNNIINGDRIWIRNGGYVTYSSRSDEDIVTYFNISDLSSLRELLVDFKNDDRRGNYYNYVYPLYKEADSFLKDKDALTEKEISHILKNMCEIACFVYTVIDEKTYNKEFSKNYNIIYCNKEKPKTRK